jgi:hypothetical protein
MIEDGLQDLDDAEEWKMHCSGLAMWSVLASFLGLFMILMSRAVTPLFYSLKPNDVLFGFGLFFQLPLIRLIVILCIPTKEEKRRRKVMRVKKKERAKQDLHGVRFQIMVSVQLSILYFSFLYIFTYSYFLFYEFII